MNYLCPVCRRNSLTVIARIDQVAEDQNPDSPTQLLLCGHCGLHAVGVKGPAGEDGASLRGYIVDKGVWSELHLSWAGSPEPTLSPLTPANFDRLSADELRAFIMVPVAAT